MRRRLFTLLSALSLALCVVTAVLWVRSYSYLEGFFWAPDLPHEFEIGSRRGTIYFGYDVDIGYDVSIGRSSKRRTGFASIDIRGDAHLWVPSEWNVLGFGLHKDNFAHWVGPIRKSGYALYVPSWFVLGSTLVLPSLRRGPDAPRTQAPQTGPLSLLRLRPPRNTRPLPGMRYRNENPRRGFLWE